MKIRKVIENDIVEDISIYRNVYQDTIELIKNEFNVNYNPSFTFDEFCIKLINNFDGVDEDINSYIRKPGKELTTKLLNSVLKIIIDDFKEDIRVSERLTKYIKKIENNH